jgi:hypothetical protein
VLLTHGPIRNTNKQHYGAWLLAALLVLLVALLSGGVPHASARAANHGVTSAIKSVRDTAQSASLAASRPTAEVPRSPLLARLAVTWADAVPSIHGWARSVDRGLSCDRRRELRRVQTRRRVPRMNSEEPPWC